MEHEMVIESQDPHGIDPLRHVKRDASFLFSLHNKALSPAWKIWLGKLYRAPEPQWSLSMSYRYIQQLENGSLLVSPCVSESKRGPGPSFGGSGDTSPTMRPQSEPFYSDPEEMSQAGSSQDGSSTIELFYDSVDEKDRGSLEKLAMDNPPHFVYFKSSLDSYTAKEPWLATPLESAETPDLSL